MSQLPPLVTVLPLPQVEACAGREAKLAPIMAADASSLPVLAREDFLRPRLSSSEHTTQVPCSSEYTTL